MRKNLNKTVTLKDPNMQNNPSMKVLGVINENDDLEKQEKSKSLTTIPKKLKRIKKYLLH